MKTLVVNFPNEQHGDLVPAEDAWAIKNGAVCVADGITRDPLIDPDWHGVDMDEALRYYPNPSPATEAAKLCCQTFVSSQAAAAHERLKEANAAVASLNKHLQCDYLVNDYAGCVAAGTVVSDGALSWASIGDCQVAHFDSFGKLTFISPNGLKKTDQYLENHRGDRRDPKWRQFVRRDLRNKQYLVGGENVAYGALTGEAGAEEFMTAGTIPFTDGVVVLFSDGFAAYLNEPGFLENLRRGKEPFKKWSRRLTAKDQHKFGRERTLVAVFSD